MKKIILILLLISCSSITPKKVSEENKSNVLNVEKTISLNRIFSSLQEIEKDYLKGNKVVMIAHPFCHFCKLAFNDFTEEMKETFRKKGIIITPVQDHSKAEELIAIKQWNSRNSMFLHALPADTNLKVIGTMESFPLFYFFKDGKLLGEISGWSSDSSNLPFLKDTLKKM